MATYYEALARGQQSGQTGRVVPSGGGAAGPITYRFVPSGVSSGVGGGGRGFDYSSLIADFQKREEGARQANIEREQEIRGTYQDLISQSQEGGAFRQAGLADIERSKTQAIGAGTQQMISSGLYGTTTAAAIPAQAESQAGLQRLKLEDMLQQRTQELKLGQAGFVERIETPYPDYNMLMQAMIAQGSR